MKDFRRAIILLLSCVLPCRAQHNEPTEAERLHTYNSPNSMHSRDVYLTNLGPTGARGWVYMNRIFIHEVEAGSPADGLLQKGDFLIGAGGTPFPDNDPRPTLAGAIDNAEGSDGKLVLKVGNKDQERSVTLQLKPVGKRSPTWPYDCKKSETIRAMALTWLREHQKVDGGFDNSVFTSIDALFLLSSRAPEDQEAARRCIYSRLDGPPADVLNAWGYGYSALALSEYYLATGDSVVLPRLEFYAREIAAGQTRSGGWCHGMVMNGIPGGYGELNSAGLVCFLSLALMQECGIQLDQAAMAKATSYFGRYAGLGSVPYGDHRPDLPKEGVPSSSGKDGIAAIAFSFLGDKEKERAFAESVSQEGPLVESAHTGAFWPALWVPLGARRAADSAFRDCMSSLGWYHELERRWDGGMEYLPNPENLTGITGFRGGPMIATGAFGLTYAIPSKSLAMLGAEVGPFGKDLSPALKPAVELFKQKKWNEFESWMKDWQKTGSSPEIRKQAEQLEARRAALQNQVDWTFSAVQKTLEKDGLTRFEKDVVNAMLKAAERLHGGVIEQADLLRGKLATAKELPATSAPVNKPKNDEGWKPILPLAKDILKDAPEKTWRAYAWTGDISPALDNLEPAGEALQGWYLPAFDDSAWQLKTAPFRAHDRHPDAPFEGQVAGLVAHHVTIYQPRPLYNTLARTSFEAGDPSGIKAARIVLQNGHQYLRSEFYLNGYRVATILRPETTELSPEAVKLFRKGQNTLAVYLTSCRGHLHDFDFGIEMR